LGQRIRKQSPTGEIWYHYDKAGRLVAESNSAGEVTKEYLWLDDLPLAVIQVWDRNGRLLRTENEEIKLTWFL
jgi:YD repeat-containing protein